MATGTSPQVDSLVVFQPGVSGADTTYGHVAYVIAVNSSTSFRVVEMNNTYYGGFGIFSERNVTLVSGISFIYGGSRPDRGNPIAPDDVAFSKGGSSAGWTGFSGGVYGTPIYTYVSPSEPRDNWGRWTFNLARLSGSGDYVVEAFITSSNAGTKNAVYHINTSGGVRDKSVNQYATSGWTTLGTYTLSSGSSWVELDDVTGEVNYANENSRIAFDAVRLTYIPPQNRVPVAVADSYVVAQNAVLTVAASGVLANDTDADGDTLAASVVAGVAHGSLSLSSSGGFTYTPAANYSGADSFTYRVYDGKAYSNPVTVAITVSPVVVVLPKASVYAPIAPSTMYRGHSYSVYGYVAPRHTSGTYLVTLKFYRRNSSGAYVYHHSVLARRYYGTIAKTKYKASVALPHTGKWRVRAYHSCSKHTGSYSGYDYITVR